ncbi:hypothetical protein [Actibacterium sp. MT2.3-13A]|uniref:hypothetical protein n=1 Tax=Actibacterium sp. MT2.3-13A TaxID=2828332 RepID=UPI001BA5567D|nr:hypothetical protein [Actibacterium sp. MT2.3-13A]
MRSDVIDIEVHLHHETAKAILVSDSGDKDSAVWLPLSQIEIEPENGFIVVTMPEWLAEEKGLI